jgi:glutathione peroxidase
MLYDIQVRTLSGDPTTLGRFRKQTMLVVNVASECGLTPQYTQLQQLFDRYGERGFTVVGFPCNQFGAQEPGGPAAIQTFCAKNYGVTFPLMEKIDVNGPARHAIYGVLTQVADGSGGAGDIQWNFEKFLVSPEGATIARFRPKTRPDDPAVIAAIESALGG